LLFFNFQFSLQLIKFIVDNGIINNSGVTQEECFGMLFSQDICINTMMYFCDNLDINFQWKNKIGRTFLHSLLISDHNNITDVQLCSLCDFLVQKGVEINERDPRRDKNALDYVSKINNPLTYELLVKYGAKRNTIFM
jgi:hypothetical protein